MRQKIYIFKLTLFYSWVMCLLTVGITEEFDLPKLCSKV